MNSLIIGLGEIGRAVREVIVKTDKVYTYDLEDDSLTFGSSIDILHICFPYSEDFTKQVKQYVKEVKPWHIIIWSTLPIGITKQVKGAVHSPVEGKHPRLTLSIKSMTRWIGANDETEGIFFFEYFKELMLKPKLVSDSNFTEFLKLRSTAKYGINLVWTEYEAKVAEQLSMDMDYVREFDRDYNKLYHNLGMDWAQRYILGNPHGKIGGHCVVPNAELLDEQFPSELLKMIKEMK